MNGVLSVLLDIFRQPSIIVALISLVGLAVQRKKATDIMKGTIRTMVGFLVLAAGASVVSGALDPFWQHVPACIQCAGCGAEQRSHCRHGLGEVWV